jgi:hypothetical protein
MGAAENIVIGRAAAARSAATCMMSKYRLPRE